MTRTSAGLENAKAPRNQETEFCFLVSGRLGGSPAARSRRSERGREVATPVSATDIGARVGVARRSVAAPGVMEPGVMAPELMAPELMALGVMAPEVMALGVMEPE